MTSTKRTRRTLALLPVVALLGASLTACGSDNGGGSAAADGEWYSPLHEYLRVVWGGDLSPEEQEAHWAEQEERRQQYIAQCMHDLGWEYTPFTGNTTFRTTTTDEPEVDWRPNDRDWVEEWGFGIIRNPWNEVWNNPEDDPDHEPEEWPTDPNWEMIQDWPEADQQAWQEALWGPGMREDEMELDDEGNPIWEWNPENAGCFGWAEIQMGGGAGRGFGRGELQQSEEFAPLFEAIDNFWMTFNEIPGIAAANREWSQCMAGKGHPGLNERWDAHGIIHNLQNEIWETIDWDTWDWERDGDISQSAEMLALAPIEIALALDEFDCRMEVNLEPRLDEYRIAAERQFVNDHQAALRALRAAAEQGR